MLWVRIEENRIVEWTEIDPEGRFPAEIPWIAVTGPLGPWIDQQYEFVDGGLAPPSLAYVQRQAKSRVALRRQTERDRGVLIDQHRWHSDKASCDDVATAVTMAGQIEAAGTSFTTVWKTLDGFCAVTLPQLVASGIAVGAHVQACFTRESAISGLIDAAETSEAVVAIFMTEIDQGWPTP